MAATVRRTIVIGLGGTGVKSVLHMKREFLDAYGEIPPAVSVLGIDTDKPKQSNLPMTRMGERVALEGREWLYASVPDPRGILKRFERIRNDFPEGMVTLQELEEGAHCIRACGRLAILANSPAVIEHVQEVYRKVVDDSTKTYMAKHDRFDLAEGNVTTYIVCSLAGGTGSGAFLDVAQICNKIKRQNDKIVGIFLLPPIFRAGTQNPSENVEGNAYAAMLELDYLMDFAGENPPDIVDYGGTFRVDWSENRPFNQVYLVDNTNKNGTAYTGVTGLEDIMRFIGRALFVNTSVVAAEQASIVNNRLIGSGVMDRKVDSDKSSRYAAIGSATIELPIDHMIDVFVSRKLHQLIEDAFLGEVNGRVRDEVEAFMRDNRMAEGRELDTVVDDFINVREEKTLAKPLVPDDLARRKPAAGAVDGWVKNQREAILNDYSELVKGKLEKKLAEAKIAVNSYVEKAITDDDAGLNYVVRFLEILVDLLEADSKEMIDEKKRHADSRDQHKKKYLKEAELSDRFQGLFPAKKIESTIGEYERFLTDESRESREIIRRECAIDFFAGLIPYVGECKKKAEHIVENLKNGNREVSKALRGLEWQRDADGFTEYPPMSAMAGLAERCMEGLNLQGFRIAARNLGSNLFDDWSEETADHKKIIPQLRSIVEQHCSDLKNTTLEDVLSDMLKGDKKGLSTLLKEFLVERASPLWDPEPLISARNMTNVFIVGVEDHRSSILTQEGEGCIQPSDYGLSPTTTAYASTGNRHQISAYQYEYDLEAYNLIGFQENKARYEDQEVAVGKKKKFTHHIRRKWAREPDILGDLFPSEAFEGTKEQMLYWALAGSPPYGIVEDNHNVYYVRSKELGGEPDQDFLIKLAHGRVNAFQAFVGVERAMDLLQEVKKEIERVERDLGFPAVMDQLKERVEYLQELAKRSKTKEVQELIRDEYKAIEAYIVEVA